MRLLYSPVALAIDHGDDKADIQTCSGAYIVDPSQTDHGFIISSGNSLLKAKSVYATVDIDSFITNDKVEWGLATIISHHRLKNLENTINSFKGAYTFEPSESGDSGISVVLLKFANPTTQRRVKSETIKSGRQFEPATDNAFIHDGLGRQHLTIHCSPFASVNPALFVGYVAHGHISYAKKEGGIILSDVRYLDGMNGGVAFIDSIQSANESGREVGKTGGDLRKNTTTSSLFGIGLVVGMLKKKRDGEMTVIAPWTELLSQLEPSLALGSIQMNKTQKAGNDTWQGNPAPKEFKNDSVGVLALSVSRNDGCDLWGSGVLISRDIVITNAHVVQDYRKITGSFFGNEKNSSVDLELISTPIDGVDLAFLRITQSSRNTDHKYPSPVKLSNKPLKPGDHVTSVGYGIFHPRAFGKPLFSTGNINKVIRMPLWDDPKALVTPVLAVASSGCWNGSSGGAVFDTHTRELVGIMASNGKVETGDTIPTMAFVIPVHQLVDYAWQLVKLGKSISATSTVRKLWALDQTHESVVNELPVAKL